MIVGELLARDEVVPHRVDADLVVLDARAAGLRGELDRSVDGEAAEARIGVAAEAPIPLDAPMINSRFPDHSIASSANR